MREGVTGAHVIHRMRSIYPDIPMILTTALPDAVTRGFLNHYHMALLAKPYDLDDLVQLLGKVKTRA
jgi:CheY-like chemotaxis protein